MPSSPEAAAAVEFRGVTKEFGRRGDGTAALRDVDLRIPRGSVFGVIGYSGAGKSTLIRMVNGLEQPTSGSVLLEGIDLASLGTAGLRRAQKTTGMVFQQFQLLETITVRDNVAMPLRLDGVDRKDAHERVAEVLDFVGLADMGGRRPAELSGGQKQRVGIARAIARNPAVLLCDEATSALDPTTTAQTIELLRRINREYGTTILLVTHEMDVIKDLAREVAVMEGGRVVEHGTVIDLFVRPQQPITEAFVGTVVPRHTPQRVLERMGTSRVWRILMLDEQVTRPLVSTLITEHGLTANILHADMTEIQEHTVGQMVLAVDGPAERVAAARAYLAGNVVSVEDVEGAAA